MECSMGCSRAEMRDSLTRTVDKMADSTPMVVMMGMWLVTERENILLSVTLCRERKGTKHRSHT